MTLLEWIWDKLPDKCEVADCARQGMRGNENRVRYRLTGRTPVPIGPREIEEMKKFGLDPSLTTDLKEYAASISPPGPEIEATLCDYCSSKWRGRYHLMSLKKFA